ncbi:MAG: hypothetical protein H6983_05550 [Ectothiorhodospiraceae bacterium]|nr:hypothetical protein [Chromatiales bacterium]MCP5153607.1 hypothetical protein [Ectothiorhodospiraceae bacterium]
MRIEPFPLVEMHAIAEGAESDFLDATLISRRTEMLQLAADASRLEDPDGCTGVVVMPEASADASLVRAQSWDWRAECVPRVGTPE